MDELKNITPEDSVQMFSTETVQNIIQTTPSNQTKFYRGRSTLILTPVCMGKTSKNINDYVMTRINRIRTKTGLKSFPIAIGGKDLAVHIGTKFNDKNIYSQMANYVNDVNRYTFGTYTAIDKENGVLETYKLISKIKYIDRKTPNKTKEEQEYFDKYGCFILIWVQDADLLDIKGSAAEQDMIITTRLNKSLSQHLYDYFSLQKYFLLSKKEKAYKVVMSEDRFRFLFTINRNENTIDRIIQATTLEYQENREEFYSSICQEALKRKKKLLEEIDERKKELQLDPNNSIKKEAIKELDKSAKEIYPHERTRKLFDVIKEACLEISEKTDIKVLFASKRSFNSKYTVEFIITLNESILKELPELEVQFSNEFRKAYEGITDFSLIEEDITHEQHAELLFDLKSSHDIESRPITEEEMKNIEQNMKEIDTTEQVIDEHAVKLYLQNHHQSSFIDADTGKPIKYTDEMVHELCKKIRKKAPAANTENITKAINKASLYKVRTSLVGYVAKLINDNDLDMNGELISGRKKKNSFNNFEQREMDYDAVDAVILGQHLKEIEESDDTKK